MFYPKITGLQVDTYFFDAAEICTIFSETITEIKDSEVDLGQPIVSPDGIESKQIRPEPFGV